MRVGSWRYFWNTTEIIFIRLKMIAVFIKRSAIGCPIGIFARLLSRHNFNMSDTKAPCYTLLISYYSLIIHNFIVQRKYFISKKAIQINFPIQINLMLIQILQLLTQGTEFNFGN